jgi:hypothetical protein
MEEFSNQYSRLKQFFYRKQKWLRISRLSSVLIIVILLATCSIPTSTDIALTDMMLRLDDLPDGWSQDSSQSEYSSTYNSYDAVFEKKRFVSWDEQFFILNSIFKCTEEEAISRLKELKNTKGVGYSLPLGIEGYLVEIDKTSQSGFIDRYYNLGFIKDKYYVEIIYGGLPLAKVDRQENLHYIESLYQLNFQRLP